MEEFIGQLLKRVADIEKRIARTEVIETGGSNPYTSLTATVNTTDASNVTLINVPILDGESIYLLGTITAKRTGGSAGAAGDAATYVFSTLWKNVAAVINNIGTTTHFSAESQAAWGFLQTGGANSFNVLINGAVNNNVTWVIYAQVYTF